MTIEINAFDYGKFFSSVFDMVERDLNLVIAPDFDQEVPAFPYVTYSFVNPHIDIGYSTNNNRQFDIVMSFATHSNNILESLTASNKLLNWFKDGEVQQELSDNGILVFQIFNQTQINNPYPIDTDRRTVFDIRLRVTNVEAADNAPAIEHIKVNDSIVIEKKGN